MKHWTILVTGSAVLAASFLSAARARAQEEDTKPKPAARSNPLIIGGSDNQDINQDTNDSLKPDNTPLTGVQVPTLGSRELKHSYWMPGFQYANTTRSNSSGQGNSSNWVSSNYLTGNISLLQAWSNAQLSLNYSGGGFFSTDSALGNGYIHQFGLTQEFVWKRWQLQFLDQFSYLPDSQFGFGGATNLGTPGVGGPVTPPQPGLGGGYVPNQSTFASIGPRYSNSFTTQAVYSLTPRASITLAGSYGLLRFIRAGNVDNDDEIGSVGYNYALSKENTLGVFYQFTAFHFKGIPQAFGYHVLNLAYGRKITGRLALQLFGGPSVSTFRVPVNNETRHVSGSGGATLTYGFSRGSLSLTFNHGATGSGGVSVGATTDQITVTAVRQISRQWSGNANFGYAKNRSIVATTPPTAPSYDSWFTGAGLSRPLGRNASLTFGYTAYIQSTNQPGCTTTPCSSTFTRHEISLGLQWHTRPYVMP